MGDDRVISLSEDIPKEEVVKVGAFAVIAVKEDKVVVFDVVVVVDVCVVVDI